MQNLCCLIHPWVICICGHHICKDHWRTSNEGYGNGHIISPPDAKTPFENQTGYCTVQKIKVKVVYDNNNIYRLYEHI